FAPLRAAAMAAAIPAGPPPTTTTSACAAIRASPAGSTILSSCAVIELSLQCTSVDIRRLPLDDDLLDHRNQQEERAGKERAHDHGGVQERRVETIGRLDDQRADAARRADPFADDGADHRCRGSDLQR